MFTKNNFAMFFPLVLNSIDCPSGSVLSGSLFADFPVHEGVQVAAPGALPCAFRRIGIAGMNHLNNEVAVEAHSRFAVDKFRPRVRSPLSHGQSLLFAIA